MKKRRQYLRSGMLCFLLFATACREEVAVIYPDGLPDQDKFARVLTEMHMIEAMYNHKIVHDRNFSERIYAFYGEVYDRHEITPEAFHQTLDWHLEHPEELQKVYDRVLDDLSHRKDKN